MTVLFEKACHFLLLFSPVLRSFPRFLHTQPLQAANLRFLAVQRRADQIEKRFALCWAVCDRYGIGFIDYDRALRSQPHFIQLLCGGIQKIIHDLRWRRS